MEGKVLRVVILPESSAWVAQCLEHDIGAQADTAAEVRSMLAVAIDVERELAGPEFKGIDEAPDVYWVMWEHGRDAGEDDLGDGLRVRYRVMDG